MEFVFKQLEWVRNVTLQAVKELDENQADHIPNGFNNNIRWNLGHIYLVHEKFSFGFAGEPMQLPEGFTELFGNGTKPSDWKEQTPSLPSLIEMLKEQPARIEAAFKNRWNERVANPFTTRSGLTLHTIGEFINFTLYHEGVHVGAIQALRRFLADSRN